MSIRFATVILGLGFALTASAQAADPNATLTEFKGQVSVNQGDEFAPAVDDMRLKPGDRVMVQDNARAEITFDDECQYAIEENKIVTIPDKSPCAGGVPVVQSLTPTGGNAIGAAGATGTSNEGVWWMVGIVAAIDLWWLNHGDDDEIVSP